MRKISFLLLLVLTYISIAPSSGSFIKAKTASTSEQSFVSFDFSYFDNRIKEMYDSIGLESINLEYKVFEDAMIGYYNLNMRNELAKKDVISIADFSQPSTAKRFYLIDLKNKKVIYNDYVTHGANSGKKFTTKYSNRVNSFSSSMGFAVTGETYHGVKGYSLRLHGKDQGYNDNMYIRGVVVHKVDYANDNFIARRGMLGRTLGCPALPLDIYRDVIDIIKGKSMYFIYSGDEDYLASTQYLNKQLAMNSMLLESFAAFLV